MSDVAKELGYDGSGDAEDVLRWAIQKYHPHIAVACSFQTAVLVHMAASIEPGIRIFAIDTGRLPEATYQCAQDVEERLGVRVEWFFPEHEALQKLTREGGQFSFRESLEARRACCAIRKVEPMNRALAGMKAWVTGVRREQSDSRAGVEQISRDQAHGGVIKIAPLADWTSSDMREYAARHNLPQNRLIDEGYPSLGCSCCTRAVGPGQHPRSGRWWWEGAEKKECGLHVRNWDI